MFHPDGSLDLGVVLMPLLVLIATAIVIYATGKDDDNDERS